MNTCGTCKHRGENIVREGWREGNYDTNIPTTFFFCNRVQHDDMWCYDKGDGAVVTDGSGYFAALCVEDDFGCNKWERKTRADLPPCVSAYECRVAFVQYPLNLN